MKLYKYKSNKEYVDNQIRTNAKRFGKVQWVKEDEIIVLASYLQKYVNPINLGICHGVRSGKEQEWFSKYLNNIPVIGTEIAPTCIGIPNTIQWDFHEVKEEWINSVDFIYSNSFDHTYNPDMCLNRWMLCVRKGGMCLIEWVHKNSTNLESDPFWAELNEYLEVVTNNGYTIQDVLSFKGKKVITIIHGG